jgi:tetratricopeptide (TPR) repeat protein
MFVLQSGWLGACVAILVGLAAQGQTGSSPAAETPPVTTPDAPPAAQRLSTPGSGELIITNPQALACQDAAKIGDFHGDGVDQCTLALGASPLSQQDVAAIYTDRGGVYLQHRQFALAKADLDAALKLIPTTADAYINRGAALLGMKQYADAIVDIDRGLELGPDQPEKAYFNRALAEEHLKDLKSAYQDFLKASQLNPNWPAPKAELTGLSP